jgi:hypothetical protein
LISSTYLANLAARLVGVERDDLIALLAATRAKYRAGGLGDVPERLDDSCDLSVHDVLVCGALDGRVLEQLTLRVADRDLLGHLSDRPLDRRGLLLEDLENLAALPCERPVLVVWIDETADSVDLRLLRLLEQSLELPDRALLGVLVEGVVKGVLYVGQPLAKRRDQRPVLAIE